MVVEIYDEDGFEVPAEVIAEVLEYREREYSRLTNSDAADLLVIEFGLDQRTVDKIVALSSTHNREI